MRSMTNRLMLLALTLPLLHAGPARAGHWGSRPQLQPTTSQAARGLASAALKRGDRSTGPHGSITGGVLLFQTPQRFLDGGHRRAGAPNYGAPNAKYAQALYRSSKDGNRMRLDLFTKGKNGRVVRTARIQQVYPGEDIFRISYNNGRKREFRVDGGAGTLARIDQSLHGKAASRTQAYDLLGNFLGEVDKVRKSNNTWQPWNPAKYKGGLKAHPGSWHGNWYTSDL